MLERFWAPEKLFPRISLGTFETMVWCTSIYRLLSIISCFLGIQGYDKYGTYCDLIEPAVDSLYFKSVQLSWFQCSKSYDTQSISDSFTKQNHRVNKRFSRLIYHKQNMGKLYIYRSLWLCSRLVIYSKISLQKKFMIIHLSFPFKNCRHHFL